MNNVTQRLYELRQISKSYDGRRVLTVEHLQIRRGEILGVVGPSGAGKSTLLRLLNFLEPPDSGTITFHHHIFRPGETMPVAVRRRVTTVFQRPLLLNRNVWANLEYGLKLRGNRDGDERIAAALRQVGLEEMARQPARTLSGGEAQRVAVARAMVVEPEVLLLDEPTANLDPYNVGLIEEIIQRLNEELSVTLVLVTHNVFQARRLAQRVVFLLEGEVIEISDVGSFFESPQDSRTGAFVRGEMVC